MKTHLLALWKNLPWVEQNITKPLEIGEGVIDKEGFDSIEIDVLFKAINHAQTFIGQSVLFRSLVQPLNKINDIEKKQRAVEELHNNSLLKNALQTLITNSTQHENHFYRLLFGEFLPLFGTARTEREIEGYGYLQYRRGVRFLVNLIDEIQHCPIPESDYLRELIEQIKAFAGSRAYALMTDGVYLTETALQSKPERRKTWWKPAIVFYPRLFKPLIVLVFLATVISALMFLPSVVMEFILASPLLLIYLPIVGGFDRDNFILPLREEFKNSPEVAQVLDSLGQIDELLSFLALKEQFGHEMILPTLVESEQHKMVLCDAKNPILAKHNSDYVGNDLTLDHEKLLLITGPNSGGKTAFCKTVVQIQLLTQIGCFVPARSATLSVADRIFYQAPEISRLNDGEGRFGAELKRTKDIFLASSAKSLVILDELSEGTTFEEKMASSITVLNGFYRKGNSTILITHNHQLVDEMFRQHQGLARQVEFLGDKPTHKLIEGISRVSHAERVAKKIGFSKEDIDNYLADSSKST